MEELIEKTIEQQFHGIDYIIRIFANSDSMCIEVEQRNTGDIWKNTFQAAYLEEITSKTGNYKKYGIFLRMLLSSFTKQSDTVFVDILTYQDLEQLKQRKSPNHPQQSVSKLTPSNKRYLILSYIVEFDKVFNRNKQIMKVHYPLPLNYDESPPVDQMKNTISKLRAELDQCRNLPITSQEQHENEQLKHRLRKMEDANKDQYIYQKQIEDQSRDLVQLRSAFEIKEREIVDLRNQIHRMKNENISQIDYIEVLKRQQDSEKALMDTNRKLLDLENEIQCLVQENQMFKQNDKKQKSRISQLEQELQSTMQKSTQKFKHNISQSPSIRKSNSIKSPGQASKKIRERLTPKRQPSQSGSFDSDTESSYNRKQMNKVTPPVQQKRKVFQSNNRAQSPSSSKRSNQKWPNPSPSPALRTKPKVVQQDTDEEERLYKKLLEVQKKNKENAILLTPSSSGIDLKTFSASIVKNTNNSQSQLIRASHKNSDSSYAEEHSNIDERLNKLSSLLRMAKET